MVLTVRDVEGLEAQLVAAGSSLGEESLDSIIRNATSWYQDKAVGLGILDRETFAHLAACIRDESDSTARSLALGALVAVQRDLEKRPDRARFVSRFALRRLSEITGRKLNWSGMPIPPASAAEANELFEVGLNDSAHSDEELVSKASDFIDKYGGDDDLFGRFAQDLEVLLDVLTGPNVSREHHEIARAALVYFGTVSDAIPDDLGPVGLLDDALVARRAVERIRPGRSVLSGYLDSIVQDWPFLVDVAFGSGEGAYPLSEFMIINAALLLSQAASDLERPKGSVIITSEPGPLAFIIGFVRSLTEVRSYAQGESQATFADFRDGERLADRSSGAEVVFAGYGRFIGTRFETCAAAEATHFRVRQPGRKSGGAVTRINPIGDLKALGRSSKTDGGLRRGTVSIDPSSARIGPLERAFSLTEPVQFPERRGRVIVVAPIKSSELLASSLTFKGSRLLDVVPMGQARVEEDAIVARRWTKDGPGGKDLLTVVRSTSEAIELAETDDLAVVGVVSAVRSSSTDATNLRRLATTGVPVVALVEERDEESQETFQANGFDFWCWDEGWLSQLRWPKSIVDVDHPVASYERRYRAQAVARIQVKELRFPALDDAKIALDQLEWLSRGRDSEALEAAVADGFGALVFLCRQCLRIREPSIESLERFRANLASGERWWPDEGVKAAKAALAALDDAVRALRVECPKQAFVVKWALNHPNGAVIANRAVREAAARDSSLANLVWVESGRRVAVNEPLLIAAWMGRATMERLIIPPASAEVALALYGPELAWYRSMVARQARVRGRIRRLVQVRSPISLPPAVETPSRSQPEAREQPTVDDIVNRVRRAQVLRRLEDSNGDDDVSARLVYFAGGHWGPFSPDYKVSTVTHLSESSTNDEIDGLRELSVSDLRPGDCVLLVRGSDHDAIRHAADEELPKGVRELAAEWRSALRRSVASGVTQADLRRSLAREGCHRAPETIRSWLNDDRIIGPKDALDGTIEAIQRATGDAELGRKLERCKEAIHLVRSTHFIVAQRLAKRVLESAREWLEIDTPPDQLVEVEDRLVLLIVESIDPEPVQVPRSSLNRLREESA